MLTLKPVSGISRRLRMPALLCLTMLAQSCGTLKIAAPPTAPIISSPVRAIPCIETPAIAFHAPLDSADAKKWLAGTLPDPKNAYDTPSTVQAIRQANAARLAVCAP
jgi:hypothetical protein